MESRVVLSESEIIEALLREIAAGQTEGEVGFTTMEFAERADCAPNKARLLLRKLMAAGRLERVRVARIAQLSGYRQMVPGFRLKT